MDASTAWAGWVSVDGSVTAVYHSRFPPGPMA